MKKEIKIIKPAKTKNDLIQNYIEEIKADFNNYNNSLWMKQGSLKKYNFEQYIDAHFHIWISNIEMTSEVEKEAYENYKKITNQMFGDKTTEHLYFWKNYEIWKENQIENIDNVFDNAPFNNTIEMLDLSYNSLKSIKVLKDKKKYS